MPPNAGGSLGGGRPDLFRFLSDLFQFLSSRFCSDLHFWISGVPSSVPICSDVLWLLMSHQSCSDLSSEPIRTKTKEGNQGSEEADTVVGQILPNTLSTLEDAKSKVPKKTIPRMEPKDFEPNLPSGLWPLTHESLSRGPSHYGLGLGSREWWCEEACGG